MLPQPEFAATLRRLVSNPANATNLTGKSKYLMEKFDTHQVTMGIKKSIKQQNLKKRKISHLNKRNSARGFFVR